MTKIMAVVEYLEGTRGSLRGREGCHRKGTRAALLGASSQPGCALSCHLRPQKLKRLHLKSAFPLSSEASLGHTFIHTLCGAGVHLLHYCVVFYCMNRFICPFATYIIWIVFVCVCVWPLWTLAHTPQHVSMHTVPPRCTLAVESLGYGFK